jgi:glutathione S-transferase
VDQAYVAPQLRALVGQRIVRPHHGLPVEAAAVEEAERALGQALAVIDRALAGERYLAGATFSLADISLMPYVAGLAAVEATHVMSDLPHLQRWWGEVGARPSWARAAA